MKGLTHLSSKNGHSCKESLYEGHLPGALCPGRKNQGSWSMSSYIGYNDCKFIHQWPKPENVTTQQNNYIKSVFLNLQTVCTAGNASISTGYPSIIDIPSFVDYILLNEISSNADAYSYSTFYHKDRNGKLRAGPAWDMNLTYGNDLFEYWVDRSKPDVWQFSNSSRQRCIDFSEQIRIGTFWPVHQEPVQC